MRTEGMVQHPGEYRWSSYRANALGEEHEVLTPHPQYLALCIGPPARQKAYRALFNTHISVLRHIRL